MNKVMTDYLIVKTPIFLFVFFFYCDLRVYIEEFCYIDELVTLIFVCGFLRGKNQILLMK